jgi:hypothetical protein
MVITDGFAKVTTIKHQTNTSEPYVSSRMLESANCESVNYSVEVDETLRKHLNQLSNVNLDKYNNLNKNGRLLMTAHEKNCDNDEELAGFKKQHATSNNKHFASEIDCLTVQPLQFENFSQGKFKEEYNSK